MAVMRRLRRHWSVLILVALFAVLLGKGSGLFSAPADGTGTPTDGAELRDGDATGPLDGAAGAAPRTAAAPDVRTANPPPNPAADTAGPAAREGEAGNGLAANRLAGTASPTPETGGRERGGADGAAAGPPATAPDAAGAVGATPPTDAPAGAGADPAREDRLAALVHGARAALQQDRLGACFSHLETLRHAVGADAVPAALETEARQRLTGLLAELAERLETGEVLHAAAILEALLEPPSRAVAAAVAGLCAERGWPSFAADREPGAAADREAATAGSAEAGPSGVATPAEFAPEPLAKDRAVRILVAEGEPQRSRIVAAEPQRVTVRIVGPSGVTFPTVPAHLVQPEGVTPGEAVELGLSAVAAGDARRAAIWCACAVARGGGGDRLALLRKLLG